MMLKVIWNICKKKMMSQPGDRINGCSDCEVLQTLIVSCISCNSCNLSPFQVLYQPPCDKLNQLDIDTMNSEEVQTFYEKYNVYSTCIQASCGLWHVLLITQLFLLPIDVMPHTTMIYNTKHFSYLIVTNLSLSLFAIRHNRHQHL